MGLNVIAQRFALFAPCVGKEKVKGNIRRMDTNGWIGLEGTLLAQPNDKGQHVN